MAVPQADPARHPGWNTPIAEAPLFAVDVETTGLNSRRDRIVAIGWVPVNGHSIDLSGSGYVVVAGGEVGESATIHGLTDDEVTAGASPAEAYRLVRNALAGRLLLAHFAELEARFLSALHRELTGERTEFPAVDTLGIERRLMERRGTYPRGEDLRLARVGERYGLPAYANHNAASDALACAELYLAQVARSTVQTVGNLRY